MSSYSTDCGKGHRHTNESLGQGRGFDEMADDHMRASPDETLLKDHLDPKEAIELAQLTNSDAEAEIEDGSTDPADVGGVTDDGQPLALDYTYAQQYSHIDPAPAHGKPIGVSDRPAADPREPGPTEWTPAHERRLCEEGAEVLDADEVDDDEYEHYDPAGFDPIEPQPYLTASEERILGEWAERQRNAGHAIELTAAHGQVALDGFADRPQPDGRTERADTAPAGDSEPSLVAEITTSSQVAALADTLGCSLEAARDQLVALAGMDGLDIDEPDAETATSGAEAEAEAETEPDAAPDLGPEATAADAAAAVANGGTGTADMAVHAVFPAPKMGHREGYARAASAHREPIRRATEGYGGEAITVGHQDPAPETLAEAAAVEERASPLEEFDADTREEVTDEAERLHEQYPFFATESAAVAIASHLAEHDGSVLTAVLAVTDEIAAWTGITPIGQLDPDDPPEQPYEQPQATIQGIVTTLYEPADASQQQVGLIDDGTGTAKLTVWEKSDIDTVLHEGDTVRIIDGVLDMYKGRPTIAAVGEQRHLPYSARSHRGSLLRVIERGDGPAPIHGLHYQVDWGSGVGFPGEQRLEYGPATSDQSPGDATDAATSDPREALDQPTLAAINQAAHRLATESDLDTSRAVIGRELAARVASDADTDVDDALMAVLTDRHLVEDADTDGDAAGADAGEDLPDPVLPRVTPAERWDEPVDHPDSATKFTLETAFTAGTWLYADETYPAPDAWPIYHRETDQYGNVEAIVQTGTLALPADTPTHRGRDRPSTPQSGASTDDDSWTVYSTTAQCPRCEAEVDANVEIKQLRAADEAGTRVFDGACGHTWRGDD